MFGKSKEEIAKRQAKALAKARAAVQKYGLDFDKYSDEDLRRLNAASCLNISGDLAGSGFYSFGSLLNGNSDQAFLMEMSRAQVEQNFILMRQNEQIIRLLKKLTDDDVEPESKTTVETKV
jgi:hypothetical protein